MTRSVLKRSGTPISLLSVDHGTYNRSIEIPVLLDVAPGMTMIVKNDYLTGEKQDNDRWIGEVIHCGGGAHDPRIHTCSRSPTSIQE